jgi:hypothetical protein
MFNVAMIYAQVDNPCEDSDPDGNGCPLDTWVFVLAGASVIFALVGLYRKQKSQNEHAGDNTSMM